jgi:hypothetical protein
MIRKFLIAAAAIAALGTASLVATPANAGGGKGGWGGGGFHHHHGHFRGHGFGLGFYPVVDNCYRDVLVTNRRGETYVKTVYVCD